MRKIKLLFLSLFLLSFGFCASDSVKQDVVLKAMQDELSRNIKHLRMDGLNRPYFISYILKDIEQFLITTTLGAVLDDRHIKGRLGAIDVRVGNYNFDNSNYGNLSTVVTPFAFEDNYDAVRNTLWVYTDLAYKRALEKFSKKKAYKEKKNIKKKLPDFTKVKSFRLLNPVVNPKFDKKLWVYNARKISEVFKKYPLIKKALVDVVYYLTNKRYADSAGSFFRYGRGFYNIDIAVDIQAQDGLLMKENKTLIKEHSERMPSLEELLKKTEKFAQKITKLYKAKTIEEVYIGPVLFKRQAAAKFFEILLVNSLKNSRTIWTESDYDAYAGQFHDRVNTRVMSALFDVTDDPTIEYFNEKYLFGHYLVDDQAVKAQKTTLIKKGKLVDILTSRAPTKHRRASNGHGRGFYALPSAYISNLFITPLETHTEKQLEEKLLNRCRQLGLDYGVVLDTLPSVSGSFYGYKIFTKDGRRELVKGLEFNTFSTRMLRDISAASNKQTVIHLNPNNMASSVIAPDILVEEVELKPTQRKPRKFPKLKHPYLD